MTQIWTLSFLISAVLLGALADDGLTAAEVEAAREGLLEALGDAVTRASLKMDELDLPPSISESVRRVAFVKVDTVKEAKNIRMHRLGTLNKAGTIGVDPITADKAVTFTLPLALDTPYLTGDLVRKVNDVGPTGHFNTTIGVYHLEVEGTASVSKSACAYNFTAIKEVQINDVDTTVEGASLLNRVLAKEMSDAVRAGTVSIKEPVSDHILQRLQYEQEDCTSNVRGSLGRMAGTGSGSGSSTAASSTPTTTAAA